LTGDNFPPGPLEGWERFCCIMVGVIAGGAGGYVAFERSNQLGAAVLLIIGGLFLLIGIQGTRMISFTSGSSGVELERKRRDVEDAIKDAQDEGNVEKASGIAQGAAIVAPTVLSTSSRSMQYESEVSAAITRLGYSVQEMFGPDMGFDLRIRDVDDRLVYGEIKYYSRLLPREAVERIRGQAGLIRPPAPIVLISATLLTRPAREAVENSPGIEVAHWRGDEDDAHLRRALERAFASIPPNATGS
jgi:hypothetical protein